VAWQVREDLESGGEAERSHRFRTGGRARITDRASGGGKAVARHTLSKTLAHWSRRPWRGKSPGGEAGAEG